MIDFNLQFQEAQLTLSGINKMKFIVNLIVIKLQNVKIKDILKTSKVYKQFTHKIITDQYKNYQQQQ